MSLSVDYRERKLRVLLDVPHESCNLPVGDLVCDYGAGNRWILERKTASDLAVSITTGRWRDQVHRLRETGCRVIFIIEGDLRATSLSHDCLLGAMINAELRKESLVIRTMDVHETAAVVRHLCEKGESQPGMPPAALTPPVLKKRERDGVRRTVWVRQLMCIPSISERIAKKLLDAYGSLPAIQRALREPKSFKRIRLDDKTCLGTTRIAKLRHYLGQNMAEETE